MRSRRPLARVEQAVGDGDVWADVGILLHQSSPAVHQLNNLRRNPATAGLDVLVEPDVGAALARALDEPDKEQAVAVHPELLRHRITTSRADDVDRLALPHPFVEYVEVEPAAPEIGNRPVGRLGVDIEAEAQELVTARVGAGELAAAEREHAVAIEQRSRSRLEIGVDPETARQQRRLVPGL